MSDDILASGKQAILVERDGLTQLADMLDEHFTKAVEILEKTVTNGGRIILTGMGKSGHVARKVAATMASTGAPASFVHPGEASHGDMGMITEHDAVVAMSNSGGAPELSDMIAYTRRFGIPLIAITARTGSALGKHADIVLLIPDAPEACPNGLAPTTSTTTTMAMGDALAVALLKRKGLTPEQFNIFHPGGKLGQRLKKVADLMDTGTALPIIAPEDTMDRALMCMAEKNVGCLIVQNADQSIAGIITDGDLKRHMSPDLLTKKAASIMTSTPKTIAPTALAAEAVDVMVRRAGSPITALLVMDDTQLCGLIRLQACLQAGIL